MKVEIENLSEVKRKILIEVPSAEVTQEVDRAYRDLGRKAKVKGFRPGKVPRPVLELYYHKQVDQEVSDNLVRRSLGEALKEKALEPVGLNWPEPPPPVVPGEDYRFSVEVEVPPEFTVEDYFGLKLSAPEVAVTEDMVDSRLEEIRQNNAVLRPVEGRGIKEGDFVVLDYQAYYEGEPVEGAKAENAYMEVGAGRFNQDFEKSLHSLEPGGEARFTVELPPDFANPLLAGKAAEFQVKILEVKEKEVAPLDDAFAQALGGNFKTLADLRAAVRDDIIKVKEKERQGLLENQALDQLLERHPFEVPPSLVRQEQESIFRDQIDRMRQYGIDMAGMNPEKMLETYKPMAQRRVRVGLLLERLAAQEQVAVDEAEVEGQLERVAAQSGRPLEQIRQFYREHDLLGALRRQLRDEKTMKLILEKAAITAAPEEPPAEEQK